MTRSTIQQILVLCSSTSLVLLFLVYRHVEANQSTSNSRIGQNSHNGGTIASALPDSVARPDTSLVPTNDATQQLDATVLTRLTQGTRKTDSTGLPVLTQQEIILMSSSKSGRIFHLDSQFKFKITTPRLTRPKTKKRP